MAVDCHESVAELSRHIAKLIGWLAVFGAKRCPGRIFICSAVVFTGHPLNLDQKNSCTMKGLWRITTDGL
jgi:hypothetical protein